MNKFWASVCCVFTGILLTACSGSTEILRSRDSFKVSQPINYYSPIYTFAHDSIITTRNGRNLVKYTNAYIDSLFTADKQNYNLGSKIQLQDTKTFVDYAGAASEFFDEVLEKGSLEELTIPTTLEAISKAYGSRYSLLLYFRPEYNYTNPSRWGAYPIGSGGVLNLKSNNFYLMLLDVENSNVIFFGKAKGKSYRAYIPELLKELNISSKS